MVVGEVASSTEVLVIGGGPGGYAAALRAAQEGRRVTLVEKGRIGGTCLHVGCIPSKVLIHAACLADSVRQAADFGVAMSATPDAGGIRAAIEREVGGLAAGVEGLLEAAGVERVAGYARFSRPNRVAVDDGERVRHFELEEAIVATGSRPVELADLPFDGERVVDSTALLSMKVLPSSLVVVGGGYIGVELGTAMAKLGVKVSIVEALDRLLPLLDRGLGPVVARRLEQLGVTLHLDTRARELSEGGLVVAGPEGDREIEAEQVLVAVGRRPNTDDLGLDRTGAVLDEQGLVRVGPDRRAAPRLLAIGDVTAGPALAHKATAEAEVAAATACGRAAAFDPTVIPAIVFSDPEVASVGLSREQAVAEGAEVAHFRFPLAASARARTLGAAAGHIEVVAEGDGTLLGVHMVGAGVSELAGEAAVAVEMGATLEDLALVIHPHPTLSEGLAEAAWGGLGRALHVRSRR
jgi:dihydrolipoamide dehydrogenase